MIITKTDGSFLFTVTFNGATEYNQYLDILTSMNLTAAVVAGLPTSHIGMSVPMWQEIADLHARAKAMSDAKGALMNPSKYDLKQATGKHIN